MHRREKQVNDRHWQPLDCEWTEVQRVAEGEEPLKSERTGGCQDVTNAESSRTSQSKVEPPSGKA